MLLAILSIAGRVCVGLVLLLAAAEKMRSWAILPGVVFNYRLLPRAFVGPVAAILPPAELTLGAALICGLAPAWSALTAMTLLAAFAAAIAVNLWRGREHIDCGCGQSFLRQALSPALLVRNAVLVLLLAPSLMMQGRLSFAAGLTAAGAGVAFFLLYLVTNILVALPRPGGTLTV